MEFIDHSREFLSFPEGIPFVILQKVLQSLKENVTMKKKQGGFSVEFQINSPILFLLAGIIVAAVLAQSVFFLLKALKRARAIGMKKEWLAKIMITAGVFTIAPAVSIVIGVIALSKNLGLALPWLRLSVVGSLSYETIAAANAEDAMGLDLQNLPPLNATQYVTIALIMTLSIMVGIWLVPAVCKKMQNGMIRMETRDKKWSDIFSASMFIGMISAFLGYVFCDFAGVFSGNTVGLIPVLVMLSAALIMVLCAGIMKLTKWKWINDYALPISLVGGMACAIPITNWLG